jgi:hypothetical protein
LYRSDAGTPVEEVAAVKAAVGDVIIVASVKLGGKVRQGTVVEVRSVDGSPPFLVQWADGGQPGLVFPGPDAHVLSGGHELTGDEVRLPGAAPAGAPPRVRTWQVRLDIFESGAATSAHAVLVTDAPSHLDAHGSAHRKAGDADIPEIGDEIAAARALRELADVLLGTAADDIAAVEGHPVTLPR